MENQIPEPHANYIDEEHIYAALVGNKLTKKEFLKNLVDKMDRIPNSDIVLNVSTFLTNRILLNF